jgi:hypothetical protein
MLYPESLFAYVQIELAEALAQFPLTTPQPLGCDRWVARSALQKACRRGEVDIAQKALANLYAHDPAAVWRHLVIICVEDVGITNVDLLAQTIAAKRDRKFRQQVGGDWHVMSSLVRLMAESNHCQAACDLLLRVMNDPALERAKLDALDDQPAQWAGIIADAESPIEQRAISAMAMGGCLADGQSHADPCGVFDVMADMGHFSHVAETCRAAWKVSRNPMTLLLPLVWQLYMQTEQHSIASDPVPAVKMIGDVPGYALDQFTRKGNQISRAYLEEDHELRNLLEQAGVTKGAYARTLGDVLFLIEGSLVINRIIWPYAERLRQPRRWLPAVATLGHHLPAILSHCEAKASQIANARSRHYHP